MARSPRPSVTEIEKAHLLIERGWIPETHGLWRHPGLFFLWPLEAAFRLQSESDADTKLADLVHLMVKRAV